MSLSLKLEIPEDFRPHWDRDRFRDSLSRIAADINRNLKEGECGLAGKYEAELADMLKDAFLKAEVTPMHEIITDPREWVANS